MSTWGGTRQLAEVMVAIGIAGAVLAAVCAVVAAIAIIRGAGGLSGGAVGLWIACALVSVTASFGDQWMPLLASCAALAAMLVVGGVVRAIVDAAGRERRPRLPRVAPSVEKAGSSPVAVATSVIATVG
ncbi:hypothetical protein [Microbacterium sp. 179-I 3D3 NHS]|uniref:hypothetical protein n=1 Tax=Microbacterium sp. 179-I 3D3 NHS TaxID=3142382 RepID=UPI0039A14CCC